MVSTDDTRAAWAFLAIVAVAAVVAALSAQEYLARHWSGGPHSFETMLFAQAIGAVVWLGFAPTLVAPLARRFPLLRDRMAPAVALHTGAGLVIAALHTFIVAGLFASYYYGYSPAATWDVFRDRMHTGYAISVLVYLGIAVGIGARIRAATDGGHAPEHDERHVRRVLVTVDGRTRVVPVTQIDWIEAADNNVVVHAAGVPHMVRGPLSTLAGRLTPAGFARVHRSTVVNLESVREVQHWFHGELVAVLKDQARVRVSRTYRDAFLAGLEGRRLQE